MTTINHANGPGRVNDFLTTWQPTNLSPELLARMRQAAASPLPPSDWVETPEDAAQRRAAQNRGKARLWEDRIPAVNRNASLDTLRPQQDPKGKVTGFLAGTRSVLLLLGPAGHGKTNCAVAVGWQVRRRGGTCVYWSCPALRDALWTERYETPQDAAERRAALDTAVSADLLVLDDLGGERRDTEWGFWTDRLYTILSARSENGRLTIITANAAGEDGKAITDEIDPGTGRVLRSKGMIAQTVIDARYTTRVARRILDFCVAAWIEGDPVLPPPRQRDPFE
jgi:DNA replication protein DnaC